MAALAVAYAEAASRSGSSSRRSPIAGTARLPLLDRRRGRRPRSWLACDDRRLDRGEPCGCARSGLDRRLCEVAADAAGGGDLDGLLASLAELREREAPEGIEDAEAAARALRDVLGEPPQLATPARLDEIGVATRRLERELDPGGASPVRAAALKGGAGAVSELQREVEARLRWSTSTYPAVAMEGSGGFFPFGGGIPRISSGRCASSRSSRPSRCRRRSASSSRR